MPAGMAPDEAGTVVALLGSEATMGNGRAGRVHSVDESQGWLARRIQRQALLAPQSCQCRRRSVRTANGTCSPGASRWVSPVCSTQRRLRGLRCDQSRTGSSAGRSASAAADGDVADAALRPCDGGRCHRGDRGHLQRGSSVPAGSAVAMPLLFWPLTSDVRRADLAAVPSRGVRRPRPHGPLPV